MLPMLKLKPQGRAACRCSAILGWSILLFALISEAFAADIPNRKRVYLTKKMATKATSLANVVNNNLSWQGNPISIGGKIYKRGLGVHADSELVYQLDKEFETLHVIPGPDDAHVGEIEMKILLDDKQVFTTGKISSRDKKVRKPVKLSLVGVSKLTLVVDSLGNKGGDHASWASLYVERPGEDFAPPPKPKAVASTRVPRHKLEPFLKEYCIDCHGPRKQKGQVRFDKISWDIADNDTAQRWQDVLDQINGGEMPPEEATQPFDDETSEFLDRLTGTMQIVQRRLTDHGGEITMRRLNQREYSNSIRHLFGFDVAYDEIPENGEIATFDTVGSEQLFTSHHFDKYLELGRRIAMESFRYNHSKYKKPSIERKQPEESVTQKLRKKLAENDRKMAMKTAGKSWQEMGFKDEGDMQILFQQWDSRAELPRKYLQLPKVDTGVYISDAAKWASISRHSDIRGDYIIRIHGGIHGEHDQLRHIVRLWDRHHIRGTLKMAGTPEKPQSVEMRVRQPMGRSHLSVSVRENAPENTVNTLRGYISKVNGRGDHVDPRPAVWIDWLEIEGPFYPEKRPKWEEILFPGKETGGRSEYIWDDSKVRELIEKFTYEAFRRKSPKAEFIDGLHLLFKEHRSQGMNHRDAMVEIMSIVLASPGFLYIQEAEQRKPSQQQQLDNRELAVRLAYFLWSSPPDDELYSQNLNNPDTFQKQVDRMLVDPKAKSFRDGFISQWVEFDRFDAITIDNREHFRFNEGVEQDAKREVREFFGVLIDENLPAKNLIDSDFAVINNALATHYSIDLPNNKTANFQKIKLPADSPRGGLMTQAAFLVAGSNGERSSPVIRGALVMEKLLHDEPAPPPPNVPELGSATNDPKTNREMVQLHQKQAVCASCHKKMDVIGFGLENFDTTGRWRDTEKVGRKQVKIQPGGTLPGGDQFTDIHELKKTLLNYEDDLAKEMVESIMAYALGRTVEFSDADDVEIILKALKPNNYRMRDMIKAVALSELFGRK